MTYKKGIGLSPLSGRVYMGKQNQAKGMWVGEKTDITDQFLEVAFAYFEEDSIREIETEGQGSNLFINIKKDKDSIEV